MGLDLAGSHKARLAGRERLSLAEIKELADVLHRGGLCSKNVSRPEQLSVRIIAGQEVGLSPVQSVSNIMVVNGKATIWGDAALALVRASGLMESHDEQCDGEHGVVHTRRKGEQEREFRFSIDDAKKAGLWDKDGPWQTSPNRMLTLRARAFALRDVYTDVLCGLAITEEERDIETMRATQVSVKTPAKVEGKKIGDDLLRLIANARPSWLRSKGVDPDNTDAVRSVWRGKLTESYGVQTATELTDSQGRSLLAELLAVGHTQECKELLAEPSAEVASSPAEAATSDPLPDATTA